MPLPNHNVSPEAAAELQSYLGSSFAPFLSDQVEAEHNYGWHRLRQAERRIPMQLTAFYQYTTGNTPSIYGTGFSNSFFNPDLFPPGSGGDGITGPVYPPPGGGNPSGGNSGPSEPDPGEGDLDAPTSAGLSPGALSESTYSSYTPASASDWSSVPSTVRVALDTLSAGQCGECHVPLLSEVSEVSF